MLLFLIPSILLTTCPIGLKIIKENLSLLGLEKLIVVCVTEGFGKTEMFCFSVNIFSFPVVITLIPNVIL